MKISLTHLLEQDIPTLVNAFASHNWHKPQSLFINYYQQMLAGLRIVWVAWCDNHLAGYATLAIHSQYKAFSQANIPEIIDLNVLPPYRRHGIASALIVQAEFTATTMGYSSIGLGVGLYGDYGAAQRLYIRHGYQFDGQGLSVHSKQVTPGTPTIIDDDACLWLNKSLSRRATEIALKKIHYKERDVLQNLASLYVYDMAGDCGHDSPAWACSANGLYMSDKFEHYIKEVDRKAYYIYVNQELAGFTLLHKYGIYPETDWVMGEFFIIKRWQKTTAAINAIHQLFKLYNGNWEISVIPENKVANRFWFKIAVMQNSWQQEVITVDYDNEQPTRLLFSFNVNRV